jgi:hypothetical protein
MLPPRHAAHVRHPGRNNPRTEAMSYDVDRQIPGVDTLNGCIVRTLDDNGERLYLIRMANLAGETSNFLTTHAGIEHLRREIEQAVLSSMFD